jgi:3'-5' exoribonuclease
VDGLAIAFAVAARTIHVLAGDAFHWAKGLSLGSAQSISPCSLPRRRLSAARVPFPSRSYDDNSCGKITSIAALSFRTPGLDFILWPSHLYKGGSMSRRLLQQMTDGESVEEVFLVSDKQLRANRNGNLYLQLELRDRTGSISARLWNAGEHLFRAFETGDYLMVKGKVQLFQGALQMILSQIERVDVQRVNRADFLPHTEHDVSKLFERLRSTLLKLSNPHLRGLAECFLMDEDFVRDFCQAPAGIRNHHAYLGGLLEHVVALMEAAERLLPLYPELDRDLLMTGIFLHDAGKIRELCYGKTFGYTDEGQLIGHLVIGVEMVNEKIKQVSDLTGEPFPHELLLRIKHLIISHHGTYEFGSPKLPMTPEAIALHHLDNFDAKVHSFARDIKADPNTTSAWTPFNPGLQRKLFKGNAEGSEPTYSPNLEGLD